MDEGWMYHLKLSGMVWGDVDGRIMWGEGELHSHIGRGKVSQFYA
jgi:hypothetical protein